MDFVIEEIDEFSGSMAHIYTIRDSSGLNVPPVALSNVPGVSL